ncbi:MAG TPA: GH116 family glycosyl hydrolase, partial [Planctomycetota bacterium]|nr:GH116 family glycosyl hydrolase [Planctomycetota bacterium]
NTRLLDGDNDGLPDHECERQTYDAWDFYGCPSYIASLWLASLKAGIRLAGEMVDAKKAARWKGWYAKGVKSFEKLWNGEYYVLWKEMHKNGRTDECCMTDQIDGDWFTALMGWGNVLPVDRIKAALRSIFRYNYSTEDGLKNATYPPGKQPRISTYLNLQEEAPWTGIEYAIASMFIDYGMIHEGLEIVRNVYDRYQRAGRVWNHVECGDHYYRAMSSWAILLAMSGFRVDVPGGTLTVAPAVKAGGDRSGRTCRLPFVAATGWGTYSHESGIAEFAATLECRSGKLTFTTLRLGTAPVGGKLSAKLNGRKIACEAVEVEGVMEVRFKKPVKMEERDRVVVRVERRR